jgi:hypothetical protein
VWKKLKVMSASSWFAVPFSALLTVGVVFCFYFIENSSGGGEPFAWFDGTSAWPSIAIILFAAFLSVHFIVKTQVDLARNAHFMSEEFGLGGTKPEKALFFGWEIPPSKPATGRFRERVDVEVLWQRYLYRGRFWTRVLRAAPMTALYILTIFAVFIAMRPFIGGFPRSPIRGDFPYFYLIALTTIVFLFLTFFVIDAILLHKGFLTQLEEKESFWPDTTFEKFEYPIESGRPKNESDLADYWDIVLISKRTEAVGGLIYYPFVILSLLIVARLNCFDDWTWTPILMLALSMHFCLALYAAWQLPKVAIDYRDKVLERLKRRRRQAFMLAERTADAIDTMIEEVESTHQGAFSYLWEQPAVRALLLPSGGIGLATLLQYLPH